MGSMLVAARGGVKNSQEKDISQFEVRTDHQHKINLEKLYKVQIELLQKFRKDKFREDTTRK